MKTHRAFLCLSVALLSASLALAGERSAEEQRRLDRAASAACAKVTTALKSRDFGKVKRAAVYPLKGDADKYVTDTLIGALRRTGKLTVIHRHRLEELVKEHAFSIEQEDLLNKATVKKLGEILGVDAVCFGAVREATVKGDAATVRLNLHLANVETGESIWSDSNLEGTSAEIVSIPNRGPTAKLELPKAATAGKKTPIAVLASDPDGRIASYRWDFGDGKSEKTSGPSVTHVYERQGTYTVQITVTDDQGIEGSASGKLRVVPGAGIVGDKQKRKDRLLGEYGSWIALGLVGLLVLIILVALTRKGSPEPATAGTDAAGSALAEDEALRGRIERDLSRAKTALREAQYKMQDKGESSAAEALKSAHDAADSLARDVAGASYGDAGPSREGQLSPAHLQRLTEFESTMSALVAEVISEAQAAQSAAESGDASAAGGRADAARTKAGQLRDRFKQRENFLRGV
jgi:TolB-like protein